VGFKPSGPILANVARQTPPPPRTACPHSGVGCQPRIGVEGANRAYFLLPNSSLHKHHKEQMQKAIIIQLSTASATPWLADKELNEHLSQGWKFVSASPFGCTTSHIKENSTTILAAILVIVETIPKPQYYKGGDKTPKEGEGW
jgi:hypothetical protein